VLGPVVVIASFANEEEAIDAANNTTYGLGSAVFTNDLKRAHRVAAEIEAGMVWINSTQDCDPRIPFGGKFPLGVSKRPACGR
jgi:aldehyde dehydrogenase (NAD(P)+)